MTLRAELSRQSVASHFDDISTGVLSPSADALFADHVVGGQILLPGVGYLEMAFIANLGRYSAFIDIAFMRPCWLPEPGANERCVLRCTRRSEGVFEIASWRGSSSSGSKFTTHFRATLNSSIYGGASKVARMASTKKQRVEYVSFMGMQTMNTVIKPDVLSGCNSQVMKPNRIHSLCRDHQSLCYFRRITSCSPIAHKPLSSVVPDLGTLPQEVTGSGSIGDITWFLRA